MTEKVKADELLQKGNDFYNTAEWDRALECWEKAKEIYEELGDKQGLSITLGNIGVVFDDKGEWERALEYYEKSRKIFEELGDKQGLSSQLGNI